MTTRINIYLKLALSSIPPSIYPSMSKKLVVASGYFDPLHYGHIDYLQRARKLGDKLVVIVNNDQQSILKKGCVISPASERVRIIRALDCVDFVVESIDTDRSVCRTLAMLHPDIFANGGDQTNNGVPELDVCTRQNIQMVDGLGDKIQSSRNIVKHVRESLSSMTQGYLDSGSA